MDFDVQIDKLSFSYGVKSILDNIELGIGKGSFTSIIGPNGSGKSTLLKIISNALKPQQGIIYLEKVNITHMTKKQRAEKISVVPQNTALEFDFKVLDVVLMGRHPYINKLKGETQNDIDIALRSMKYTNTLHLSERSFNELSGGERQRVILAQALTQQPQVLLLDEPVSHLDLQHQIEVLNLIKRMSIDNQLTVIAVLHDLNLASTYSDVVFMLKDGQLKHQGTPHETLTEKNIKEVFNIDTHVTLSPVGNKPYIYTYTVPVIKKNNFKIHVICGGGSGSDIIKNLYQNGFDISSGVLSIGDLDWKVSRECNIDIAEDIPFVDISDAAYEANKELAVNVDVIVLTGLYFGKANIKNLEILTEPDLLEKPLFILEDESFTARDFTEGNASKIYDIIKGKNRVILTEQERLIKEIYKVVKQDEE